MTKPRRVGDDYICPRCGEPWDAWGVERSLDMCPDGDMTYDEAKKFMEGKGCPSCPVYMCPECGYFEVGEGFGGELCPVCEHGTLQLLSKRR
jgi:rubrerythrin